MNEKLALLLTSVRSHITLTNMLLVTILVLVFSGFYISAPQFKNFIDNIGYSTKAERVGTATFICTYGKLTKEEYESRIDELNKQIEAEKLKDKLLNMDLITLKVDLESLQRESYLTTKKEDIDVIRTRKFRFGFTTYDSYGYAGEIPKDGMDHKCKCEKTGIGGLCEWKPINKVDN
ncbi:hypothetical protein HYS92_00190 [Candidatus Daviesbacteria bacterium]|nr:hypothetical protein [Candidatus Daviesbacteria bacterium]